MTATADRFGSPLFAGRRIEIATPEGVPLVLTIATIGERLVAFTLDAILLALVFLAVALTLAVALAGGGGEVVGAVAVLALFLLRNGWFVWFEIRTNGRTPGKRRTRLRVLDAHGDPLRPMSIVVRNLTREVELFLPIVLLSSPESVTVAGPGWVRALSVLWVLAFALVPWLDRHHRRVGDLLGGTLVVREPYERLLGDLAAAAGSAAGALAFTAEQLGHYGIYELQVLERLLRDESSASAKLQLVAERIAAKIGAGHLLREVGARRFLDAFYAAQRARLERDLALGRARERKAEPPPAE